MANNRIKMINLAALFAAITAVCAQLSFTVGPVPFTLQVFAICLTGLLLGSRWGSVSVLVYLVLGAVGVPVFAGFQSGLQTILGKTGGYLLAFLPAVFVIGLIAERGRIAIWKAFLANLLGLAIIYTLGTMQLEFMLNLPWSKAIAFGIIPFLIPDVIKIAIASSLGVILLNRLASAGFLPDRTIKRKPSGMAFPDGSDQSATAATRH
ncbi:biotin transporter BioY [Brevibacillus fluminis]|uniref:biotin transporter BioY n=1 Tax=Brevibacillus fluminis TaxID=511487 RepID=UPI003F89428E